MQPISFLSEKVRRKFPAGAAERLADPSASSARWWTKTSSCIVGKRFSRASLAVRLSFFELRSSFVWAVFPNFVLTSFGAALFPAYPF